MASSASQVPSGDGETSAAAGATGPRDIGGVPISTILSTVGLNDTFRTYIDPDFWHFPADDDADLNQLITKLTYALFTFATEDLCDDELFYAFREEFQGWSQAMFERLPPTARRVLKNFLRTRGVYTGRNNGQHAPQLLALLQMDTPPNWDQIELGTVTFVPQSRMGRPAQPPKVVNVPVPAVTAPGSAAGPESAAAGPSARRAVLPSVERPASRFGVPHQEPSQWRQSPFPAPGAPPSARFQPAAVQTPIEYDPYRDLPPRPFANTRLDAFKFTQFTRAFQGETKWTGEPYDLLDDKLKVFLNICYHTEIEPGQFTAVLPRIMEGRALTFYVHFIKTDDTFAEVYTQLKKHFDTEGNHHQYFTEWTTTTFSQIRAKNPDKSLHEVLQTLLDKLQLCQRALGREYAGEDILRTAVVKACRGVPELEYALFRPAQLCEELFSDLRSSIETNFTRDTRRATAIHTQDHDQYYVDRKYNNYKKDRDGGYGSRQQSRSYSRPSYKPESRVWKKKCFICKKEGCWSTKHSADDRRRAKTYYLMD